MQRLPDSANSIALGFACGVYASFTPFFGFHFVIAAALAWLLRANLFASAVGTFFGNPITFGFIMWISLTLGGWIMGIETHLAEHMKTLGFIDKVILLLQNIPTLVVPYFVGGLIPGIVSALICYLLVKPMVSAYQQRRQKRMMARARKRLAAQLSTSKPAKRA